MGFNLTLNFNHPYFATSLSDFWRRWHISLSSWLRDYIYTPIVLNKRYWGVWGAIFALMITFSVSGLWHGASWTFVAWGVLHGIGLSAEMLTASFRKKYFKIIPRWIYSAISLAFTFSFVTFTYIFFRAQNLDDAMYIVHHLLERSSWANPMIAWPIYDANLAKGLVLLLLVVELMQRYISIQQFRQWHWIIRRPVYYSFFAMIMTLGQWTIPAQFIYFQF